MPVTVVEPADAPAPTPPTEPEVLAPPTGESRAARMVAETEEATPAAQEAADGAAVEPPAPTKADVRARFLEAERVNREALKREKASKEMASKTDRLTGLAAKWKDDPLAIPRELGIDPAEFLDAYTLSVVKAQAGDVPLTPEEERINAAIAPLAKELEQARREKEEFAKQRAAHEQAARFEHGVVAEIVPVLDDEKHEVLLSQFGFDKRAAGRWIGKKILEHYEKTGREISPKDAADELDAKFDEQVRGALGVSRKMKRYQGEFTAAEIAAAAVAVKSGARTLTSKDGPTTAPKASAKPKREPALTPEERRAKAVAAWEAAEKGDGR